MTDRSPSPRRFLSRGPSGGTGTPRGTGSATTRRTSSSRSTSSTLLPSPSPGTSRERVEASQKPMFDLLGAPARDKKHALYPGGHGLNALFSREIRGDILAWLDRYLGPVGK